MFKVLLKMGKAILRDRLGQYAFMIPLLAYRSSWEHVQIRRDSAICIEGYPRSANTYSVAAFNIANPDTGHVARHSHLAGQVIRAIQWRVPAVVLIRKPEDAILSLKIREPDLAYKQLISSYIRFYRMLLPYKEKFYVACFEEVTNDFNSVVGAMNSKFECDFKISTLDDESVFDEVQNMFNDYQKRMFLNASSESSHIAKPSKEREMIKEIARKDLRSSKYEALLVKAENLYQEFIR